MTNERIAFPVSFQVGIASLVFVFTFALRVWGIDARFLLLGDQMRDWSIALRPFSDLPLVGPATHVHGYTIGPAFYWILWAIRVSVGPWFDNLPHAGGIGQAALQSAADAMLLVAIWRRTKSIWIALATVVLVATAPFDLSLSALVWNPVMGSTLAKMAMALALLDWHRGSLARVAVIATIAWSAVHAYTGAVFVTVSVFAVALVDPLIRGERRVVSRNAVVLALVVFVLQVPYLIHQLSHRFDDPAMSAVTGSVGRILSGADRPELAKSVAGYLRAFDGIQVSPWQFRGSTWVLLAAAIIVAVRYGRDLALLATTLLPGLMAIVGYAFFLGALDNYYYLSLMPAAVLTIVLAVTAVPWQPLARGAAIVLLLGALTIVPVRRRHAMTMNQMPQYGLIVEASRVMARRGTPLRAIRTDFRLDPTNDPEFVYRLLGGRIDPSSPWVGVITSTGEVVYENRGRA